MPLTNRVFYLEIKANLLNVSVRLMEKLSQCCPNGDSPEIADLHESYCNVKLPSAKELQVSHEKLKELIRPGKQFNSYMMRLPL